MATRSVGSWRTVIGPSVAAGLIGGTVVGAAESVWILRLGAAWPTEHTALRWGAFVYGLLGALGGAGVGAAIALLLGRRRVDALDVFGLGLGVVFAASLLIVFRFRHQRDVLHELPLGLLGQTVWLVASILVGVLCWLALPALLRRAKVSLGWRTCAAAGFSVIAFTMVASLLLPRSGVARFHPAPNAQAGRPHILYVMADTVRADFLSPYGAEAAATPASARLAADGVVFEQAIAQSSWTRPSVATQLTSLLPHRHGARFKSSSIRADAVLLSETLAAAGYYCVGYYDSRNLAPEWGFARGYHRYRSARGWSLDKLVVPHFLRLVWVSWRLATLRPEDVHDTAAELLRTVRDEWAAARRDAPIFFFVHLMDAHDPYFPRSTSGAAILRDDRAGAAKRDRFRAAYGDGVAAADAKIHALVEWLDAEGLYDDMLIVLVSDHGEEFFEHGGYWHGLTLYEELIHVPLIVKLPHRRLAGARQPALVRLLDLAPTIATVAGVASPPQWTGTALIRDGALVDPQLRSTLSETDLEGGTLRALRGVDDKLIVAAGRDRRGLPPRALFALDRDAGEQSNLAPERGGDVSRLEAELVRQRDGDLWR